MNEIELTLAESHSAIYFSNFLIGRTKRPNEAISISKEKYLELCVSWCCFDSLNILWAPQTYPGTKWSCASRLGRSILLKWLHDLIWMSLYSKHTRHIQLPKGTQSSSNHLQPSCFLRPSKRDGVDVDLMVQSITNDGCYPRSEVESVYKSSAF